MKIIVYWMHQNTDNKCEYDNEENPVYFTESSSELIAEVIDSKDIKKEFDKEDGDGDDSGSWGRYIEYVVDAKTNTILFNSHKKRGKEELEDFADERDTR